MAAFPTETVAVNLVYCGPIDVNNVWRIPILCGLIKKCPLCRYIVRKTNMTQPMTVITSLHEYSVLSSFSIDNWILSLSTHLHSLIDIKYIWCAWGVGAAGCFTIYPACPNKSYFCTKEKERNQHLCKKRCSICIIEHNLTRNYFVYLCNS